MPAEAVWSPVAVADLDTIWKWVAVENGEPAAAERTITLTSRHFLSPLGAGPDRRQHREPAPSC